jgi:hypothetical protein
LIRSFCAEARKMAPPKAPTACAVENTVIGTVASASYALGLLSLARSAAASGFPCVVVQPFDYFEMLEHELVVALPVPSPPLLPRSVWCGDRLRHKYGWRRSQLHRVRLWRSVLALGLDLLALDLDHMPVSSPVAALHALWAPPEMKSHLKHLAPSSTMRIAPADVVAVWDGPGARYLNVGIMWVRSTDGTRELSRRAENRSWAGWEQQVFNEELNFNEDLVGIRCCHTPCLKHWVVTNNASRQLPSKSSSGTAARQRAEGSDRCSDDAPLAAAPPRASTETWANRWHMDSEALSSRHTSNRRYGRCNHDQNICVLASATGNATHLAAMHSFPHRLGMPPSNCTLVAA